MFYLDNAATTKPLPEVVSLVSNFLKEGFGNPSSVHPPGIKARKIIDKTRQTLAEIFQVPQAGIVFCSSGTESDNLAIKGVIRPKHHQKGRIITTPLEHSAVSNTCKWAAKQYGLKIDVVNIDQQSGLVDLNHLESLIARETVIASIQHVNSETGIVQNLTEISQTIKSRNKSVVIHSDGVQAFSRIPINLSQLGIDIYSISAHKFHGIKGGGALILNENIPLQPLVHGGGQEHGLRSGTENVAAIGALGIAAKKAVDNIVPNNAVIKTFADLLKKRILKEVPGAKLIENENTVPYIVSLSIKGILGEVLLHHLAKNNIFVSTGSACNASTRNLSPVLKALGFTKERIMQTVRISLAACEIPEDQEGFAELFIKTVMDLKNQLE